MDKKQLKIYYMYFIPITILQSITSILMMGILSVDDYGMFTLYLSAINFFFFLTLGIQNGYTILILEEKISKISKYVINNALLIGIVILFTISFPILMKLNIEIYWKLGYLSALTNVIFVFHKAVFRVEFKIHSLNIYTLLYRVTFLLDIIVYIIFKDIIIMMLFDVFSKAILSFSVAILFCIRSFIKLPQNKLQKTDRYQTLIQIGVPIMMGNWLISMYTIFDKTFLSENSELLGLYSFAITSVLLVRIIILPLSELYFVTVNTSESADEYYNKLKFISNISMVVVILGAFGAVAIFKLGLFAKYQSAIPALLILLNIIPISASLDIVIYNVVRRINIKYFLMYSISSAIMSYVLLYIYTSFFTINLIAYSYVVYLTYLVTYILFNTIKLSYKQNAKLALKNIAFLTIYSVIVFTFI